MLIIDGQSLKVAPVNSKCAPSLLPTLVTSAALKHASQRFATQESVDPVVQQIKSICVLQGEFAKVDLTQERVTLASTDATTCCICAIVAPQKWALIAHLDERCGQQMAKLAPLLSEHDGRAQLFLVGGYGDRGAEVTEELLKALHALPQLTLDVRLAVVGDLNKRAADGGIMYRGLAVDTATCSAWPPKAQDRGPLWAMRAARPFSPVSPCMEAVYDPAGQRLRILPVHLDTQSLIKEELLQMISLPDAELLEQSSTSPEQEGPGFPEDVRNTFRWMLQAGGGHKAPAVFSWTADKGWLPDRAAVDCKSRELAIAL